MSLYSCSLKFTLLKLFFLVEKPESADNEDSNLQQRQQSPAGQLLTADSEQLLTEELDAIDCAMAGGEKTSQGTVRFKCQDLYIKNKNNENIFKILTVC